MMTDIPIKQRTAREQIAAGVTVPYWVDDLDQPINYHLKMILLTPEELDRLTIICRKQGARLAPNPLDNRTSLDYPPTNRERVDVLRHVGLNRTTRNIQTLSGYNNSYDNLLHRILIKGVDVEARQKEMRRQVLSLIAEHYPYLKDECVYQQWLADAGMRRKGIPQ